MIVRDHAVAVEVGGVLIRIDHGGSITWEEGDSTASGQVPQPWFHLGQRFNSPYRAAWAALDALKLKGHHAILGCDCAYLGAVCSRADV
ncbi:hypothetical protein N9C96_00720 [bacterium]|nr:hypothetical protein [bacterium]